MRSSNALSASPAVALFAGFKTPDLNASLIAVAGSVAFDRLSVSRCENLQFRMAAPVLVRSTQPQSSHDEVDAAAKCAKDWDLFGGGASQAHGLFMCGQYGCEPQIRMYGAQSGLLVVLPFPARPRPHAHVGNDQDHRRRDDVEQRHHEQQQVDLWYSFNAKQVQPISNKPLQATRGTIDDQLRSSDAIRFGVSAHAAGCQGT